jgi:hypothetical protein
VKRLALFCIGFFIFSLMFVTFSNAKIDFNKAAGIWLFEEKDGAVIKDFSKNGNNGKATGTKHVAGKYGSALSFNGTTDNVVVPDADSLDLQGAWTISAWVKVNKTEVGFGHILGKRPPALAVVNYAFRTEGNPLTWAAYFATDGAWRGIWGQGTVKTDQWSYMTATYDGKDVLSIYENGVQIGTLAGMGAPAPANDVDVVIGGWKDDLTELLDGTLDEVILMGDMLTTDDMVNLMNNGVERAFGITAVDKQDKVATEWGSIKSSR